MTNSSISIGEIVKLTQGKLIRGDSSALIAGIQTLAKACTSQATFLANMKYKADLESSKAGLVFMSPKIEVPENTSFAVIQLPNPYAAFATLQRYFHPEPVSNNTIHPSASIAESAVIGENVQINSHVTISEGVSIGAGTIIQAGCVIAAGVSIGRNCLIHPRVTIEKDCLLGDRVIIQAGAVIGSDGFGFAWNGSEYLKIPQVGRVILEDDVEIGSNTCIDRGAIEDTIIRSGAKLDNLIQIAHNVEVGQHTVIAGQAGFAGSTVIGKGCQFGAQSGVAGHLKLVDGTIVGAKAGVIGNITEPGMVSGFPAVPHRHWLKASAFFDKLPEIWNKIKRLT